MSYRPSRRSMIALGLIVLAVIAFISLLPEIVRRGAISRLEQVITAPIAIADIDLNLFTGRAHVENFIIGDAERPILRVPALSLRFSPIALLSGQIKLQQLVLEQPALTVERTGPDRYNVIEVVNLPSRQSAAGPGSFSLETIEIHGGEIVFVDRTQEPDYRLNVASLNLTAGPIATLPADKLPDTGFHAGFKIGGGSVTVSGTSHGLHRSPAVEVKAEISDVDLRAFDVYLPYGGKLNLEESRINGYARYILAAAQGENRQHALEAGLRVGGIGLLTDASAEPIAVVSGLQASNIRVDFLTHRADVENLVLENPEFRLERDAQGWNFARLLERDNTRSSQRAKTAPAGAPMALHIRQIEAHGGVIDFIDHAIEPMVARSFDDANLSARNLTLLPNLALPDVTINARLEQGTVSMTGAVDGQPLKGDFTITGSALPFEPFRGYLNQLLNPARWSGATLNGELKLALRPLENDRIATEISGALSGDNVALRFPDEKNPFVSSRQLSLGLRSLRFGESPGVDIEAIRLTGAELSIVRNGDGTLNLSQLWSAGGKASSSNGSTKKQTDGGIPLVIRGITVDESDIAIRDTRVSPNYNTRLSRVSAKLSALRKGGAPTQVKLEGVLGESARLKLSGWFSPFTERTNMHLEGTIQSYALPPLNPYAAEYVSHRIERGEITMAVEYNLKEGEFEADADIVLRDVRIGERTGDEFNRRIGIPLELAVALLEDINGVIRLQLALDGEGGPEIDIASLIWRAVRNAIVRTVSAPFRLIGNVLTLGGRIGGFRVEPILFEPGMAVVRSQSAQQLDEVGQLLENKPRIELRLTGQVSETDIETLKREIFWSRINAAKGAGYQQALVNVYKDLGGITEPAIPLDPKAESSLERFVMKHIEIDPAKLAELAQNRAEVVRQELAKRGVAADRLLTIAQAETGAEPVVTMELVS